MSRLSAQRFACARLAQQPRTRTSVAMHASAQMQELSPMAKAAMAVMEKIIRFRPIFNSARESARKRILDRGEAIGVFMAPTTDAELAEWEATLAEVQDPDVELPAYYTGCGPDAFHAYEQGNLCWEAALEFELVTKAVHATVMDPETVVVDPEGDAKMRRGFHDIAAGLMRDMGAMEPGAVRDAVDLGSSMGLSSRFLAEAFPAARITGIDASPHFVSVGHKYLEREELTDRISLRHGLAEDTKLPEASADIVSISLCFHELPASASRAVMAEAYRLLRPGGVFLINEMDPRTPKWQQVFGSPILLAAFKSTEPWLLEYVGLDVFGSLREAGFDDVHEGQNTPSHMVVVARKRP